MVVEDLMLTTKPLNTKISRIHFSEITSRQIEDAVVINEQFSLADQTHHAHCENFSVEWKSDDGRLSFDFAQQSTP